MPPRNRTYDPTTRAEFEALVKQLISDAHANYIDVDGGIDVRHPSPEVPDWTVEITRIENTAASDDAVRSRQTLRTREDDDR